jgi:hypothetical protein
MYNRFFSQDGWHLANLIEERHRRTRFFSIKWINNDLFFRVDEMDLGSGNGNDKLVRLGIIETSDYLDFKNVDLADTGFFSTLVDVAKKQNCDVILLSNIVSGSKFDLSVNQYFYSQENYYKLKCVPTFGIHNKGSFANYLKSIGEGSGRNLIRIKKKLAKSNPVFGLEPLTEWHIAWQLRHQKIRAKDKGYDIFENSIVDKVLRRALGLCNLRFASIKIDGKIACGMTILEHGDSWGIYLQAFDMAYSKHYVSICLLSEIIEASFNHNISYIDLLRGDESYKKRYCNTRIDLRKIAIKINQNLSTESLVKKLESLIE